MFSKISKLLLLSFFVTSSVSHCVDMEEFKESAEDVAIFCKEKALVAVKNDKVQSFVAGIATELLGRKAINLFYPKQPIRGSALTSMIILANLCNVFRSNNGKALRLVSALFGVSAAAFIRN